MVSGWLPGLFLFFRPADSPNTFLVRHNTQPLTQHQDLYVRHASCDGTSIVYQRGGWLHRFDLQSSTDQRLEIITPISRLQVAPYLANPLEYITTVDLHPEAHSVLVGLAGLRGDFIQGANVVVLLPCILSVVLFAVLHFTAFSWLCEVAVMRCPCGRAQHVPSSLLAKPLRQYLQPSTSVTTGKRPSWRRLRLVSPVLLPPSVAPC